MVYFNFFNFVAIFLEFSISRRLGAERTDNFYFLPFLSSFNLWWLEIEPLWYFLIFLVTFLEFSITRWVGTKRNNNIYFHSFLAFSNIFWLEMNP